jgi:hypothetical protein
MMAGTRWQHCTRKRVYQTENAAKEVVARREAAGAVPGSLVAYLCTGPGSCGLWHVGHQRRKDRRRA